MLCWSSMTDFAKIALATDHVRPSKTPETWNIGGFITVSVVLASRWSRRRSSSVDRLVAFRVWQPTNNASTPSVFFCCSTLPYSPSYRAGAPTGSGRQCRARPSWGPRSGCAHGHRSDVRRAPGPHALALVADVFAVFVYAMVACLGVNDAVKVAMIKWRVLGAVAKKPVDGPRRSPSGL